MRIRQIAPGSSSCLPDLRLHVDTSCRIYPTTDYKHITVGQTDISRIPATIVHVRERSPGVVKWAIDVGIRQSHPVADMSARHQPPPIGQKSVAGAEDVCSGWSG